MTFESYALRRQKSERNGEPEIFTYDRASEQLRHQLCSALLEGIGPFCSYQDDPFSESTKLWFEVDRLCHKEIFSYTKWYQKNSSSNAKERFLTYIMNMPGTDDFLSAVEFGCLILSTIGHNSRLLQLAGARITGAAAIKEINARFQQHAVGYQFDNGQIIRVDSKLTHAEIIKPALSLLTAAIFKKANEDFLTAHHHYRERRFKDCVTSANRAFESMLKAICEAKDWVYSPGDRAAELVTIVSKQGLFIHRFDKQFMAYVGMLKAGLPSIRNQAGAHGEGPAAAAVTAEIARFAINMTATNLLFLGECYNALT